MSEYQVEKADADIRLDRWFKRHFPNINHGMLEKALRKGDVRVEGKKAKASDRVQEGQRIESSLQAGAEWGEKKPSSEKRPAAADAEMMQGLVLFKNADAIVINKPSGLAVQGGSKITKSVDGMLDTLRFDARERPKLVHRLDKDTSGVLVLARNASAATLLAKAFSGKTADKTYWALVKGAPPLNEGKIDLALAKQEEGDVEKVAIDKENGRRAVTLYRVIERLSRTLTFVELMPITGRTHQLRVHMAAIGHPIIGDGKYGAKEAFMEGISNKLHLHARRIVIPGVLDVEAPLPRHMQETWNKLGLEG